MRDVSTGLRSFLTARCVENGLYAKRPASRVVIGTILPRDTPSEIRVFDVGTLPTAEWTGLEILSHPCAIFARMRCCPYPHLTRTVGGAQVHSSTTLMKQTCFRYSTNKTSKI